MTPKTRSGELSATLLTAKVIGQVSSARKWAMKAVMYVHVSARQNTRSMRFVFACSDYTSLTLQFIFI